LDDEEKKNKKPEAKKVKYGNSEVSSKLLARM